MSVSQGLIKGRSHIVFMLGLVAAFGIILSIEQSALLSTGAQTPLPSQAAVIEAATAAWQAAARSHDNATARSEARKLGVDTDVLPGTAAPAMSPAAGAAILAALAAQRRAAPAPRR